MKEDSNKKNESNDVTVTNDMVEENKEDINSVNQEVKEVSFDNVSNDNRIDGVEISSSGGIEEISVETQSSSLNEIDVSSNSVFNKQDDVETNKGSLKEGQEHLTDKKGFPYGMVIIFVIVIICAFFIDNIVDVIEKIGKGENQEENVEQIDNEENKDNQENTNEENVENNNENAIEKDNSLDDIINNDIEQENNDSELSENSN